MSDVDIPEEYLDPVLGEPMVDPVLLPGSGRVMDRRSVMMLLTGENLTLFQTFPSTETTVVHSSNV